MSRVFLLEDDAILGQTLKRGFELEGYEVTWVRDLKTAKTSLFSQTIEIYILDWNLPDGTGLTVCEWIRQTNSQIPILMLTARTEEERAVESLASGANDYVRKPCGQKELTARVKRLLGEALSREQVLRFGDLALHLGSRKAKFKNVDILIQRKEFDVLAHLIKNGDVVSSREAILGIIDAEQAVTDRAVDTHMSRLRNRFKEFGIETIQIKSIYGQGYRLEKAS